MKHRQNSPNSFAILMSGPILVLVGAAFTTSASAAITDISATMFGNATAAALNISTQGTLVAAVNLGSNTAVTASPTVGGVTFTGFGGASPSGTNWTITGLSSPGTFNARDTETASAATDLFYTELSSANASTINLTYINLDSSKTYLVQVFNGDARNFGTGPRRFNTNTVSTNVDSATALPDFEVQTATNKTAVVEFTISGATSFTYLVPPDQKARQITGFQVRQIPEPSSLALLALGALVIRRRR